MMYLKEWCQQWSYTLYPVQSITLEKAFWVGRVYGYRLCCFKNYVEEKTLKGHPSATGKGKAEGTLNRVPQIKNSWDDKDSKIPVIEVPLQRKVLDKIGSLCLMVLFFSLSRLNYRFRMALNKFMCNICIHIKYTSINRKLESFKNI